MVQCLTHCTLLSPSSAPHFSLSATSFFFDDTSGALQYDRSRLLTAVKFNQDRYETGDMVRYAKADSKLDPSLPLSHPSQTHIGRVIRFVVSDDPANLNGLVLRSSSLFFSFFFTLSFFFLISGDTAIQTREDEEAPGEGRKQTGCTSQRASSHLHPALEAGGAGDAAERGRLLDSRLQEPGDAHLLQQELNQHVAVAAVL